MSSSSESVPGSGKLDVVVLKSWNFAEWRDRHGGGEQLPYRMDHLESNGLRLHWTDTVHEARWEKAYPGRAIRRIERATVPVAQTVMMAPSIRRAPITFAMFESEANFLAISRRAWPGRSRSVLAVLTCWLASILAASSPRRLSGYRWVYRSVDRFYYLSRNQGPILQERLRLPASRFRYLPFGVDTDTFRPTGEPDADYLLVVGRDRGRDWRTLFEAVGGLDMPVKVCCRPSDVAGYEIPSNVELLGYVDRDVYRHLLGRARVVAVVSKPVVYPSGQSVMLEAMAMSRAVVVTATEAMAGYVNDGRDGLAVPAADPDALRLMIETAAADDQLRSRLGAEARRSVVESFNARMMWETVAEDLLDLSLHKASGRPLGRSLDGMA